METIVLFTNPFDETVSQLIEFIQNIQTEHLYNSIYKITFFVEPEIYKDTLAMTTEINYPYLYVCTDQKFVSINNFTELYNNCIYDFTGIYATRMEIIYIKNKVSDTIYVKIIPYIDVNRLYMPQDLISTFMIQYRDILFLNNVYVSSDPLAEYGQKLLTQKSLTENIVKVNSIYTCNDSNYADKLDTMIMKLRYENVFSLIEFKDDPLFLIILELVKAFEVTQINDYEFQYNKVNLFECSIKTWLIKSALRLLDDELPIYRFQINNDIDMSDEYLRPKARLAAILSYLKITKDVNISKIQVLDDMTVIIPVVSLSFITLFNEYMSVYLEDIDNWSITLCPTLEQAVTLKDTISSKSKLSKFDSYIVDIDDDEYLIILTSRPEMIKYDRKIAKSKVTENSRGYASSDIKSEWIRFYAKEYNLDSNLLLFKDVNV